MKAVLDTNVIVSAALIARSIPDKVLQAAKRREFDLLTSATLLDELEDVLERGGIAGRLGWSHDERSDFLSGIRERAIVVSPQTEITRITSDPDDNRVLEAAVEGRDDYIVTGDGHLLDLGRHESTDIVTPARFLAILTTEATNP